MLQDVSNVSWGVILTYQCNDQSSVTVVFPKVFYSPTWHIVSLYVSISDVV